MPAIIDMMRDDLGMPVDYIGARKEARSRWRVSGEFATRAVQHYKKLRAAALNVSLRVATEKGLSDDERKILSQIQGELEDQALKVRLEAIKKRQSDVAARAR